MTVKSCVLRGILAASLLAYGASAQAYSWVHATYLLSSVKVCSTSTGCNTQVGSAATTAASKGGYPQGVFEYCMNSSGNFYTCDPSSAAADLVFKWTDVNSSSWENRYSAGSMYPYPYPVMSSFYGTNGWPASSQISIGNNQPFNGQYGGAWIACSVQDYYTWHCWYGTGGPGWYWSIDLYYSWVTNNWYPYI